MSVDPGREVASGRVRWYALLSLLLLAATMAEFLTGSTPILRVAADPVGFLFLVGMYGGGALLIREAAIRWGKRWGTVLLLGGAYAVGEEGFDAKTMIDPTSPIIGNQLFTHYLGVNWVPLAALTLFHAAFSITVPLVLLELLFPETKGRSLVGNRGLVLTMVTYGFVTAFLVPFGDPYVPSMWVYLFLAAYALAFVAAAFLAPKEFLRAKLEAPDRSGRRFVLLGLGFLANFFLVDTVGIHLLPWQLTAALFVPLAAMTALYLVEHAGRSGNEIVKVSFVLGMLLVFVPIDVLVELGGDVGVLAYTALILVLVLGIRRRIVRRGQGSVLAEGRSVSVN